MATPLVKLSGVNGFKVNYTPNISSATAWTGQIASPVTYTRTTSIDNFAVADGSAPAHTYSQTGATGIRSGQFTSIGATKLGGTTYTYSRFGWLSDSTTETNGSTTAWYTPFALASTTPIAPTNLSYAGTQQALVYIEGDARVDAPVGLYGYAICDTSANYTASSKTLQLALSNCTIDTKYTLSGSLTLANGTGSSTLKVQGGTTQQTVTSATVDSGNFLLAGPNGEELVDAATVKGSIALSDGTGSSNPAIFFVIFGGKTQ